MAASQHAPLTVQVFALDAVRKVTCAATLSNLSTRLSLGRGTTDLSHVCVCCVQYRRRSCAWQPSPLEKRYCQLDFIMNIINVVLAARRTSHREQMARGGRVELEGAREHALFPRLAPPGRAPLPALACDAHASGTQTWSGSNKVARRAEPL